MIKIERPIVFVDFETTGTDTMKDRIVEMSFAKLNLDASREVKTYRVNPEMAIPKGASDVHGITNADVDDKPTFKSYSKGILAFIEGCDLGGFKSNQFDFPLLYMEFNRAGINWDYNQHQMIDCGNIFTIKEPRTLAAAVKFYCGIELEGAHGAECDILGTISVFESQLLKYFTEDEEVKTISDLALFSNYGNKRLDMAGKFVLDKDGETILLNFGKLKGQPAKKDRGFLNWMTTVYPSFPKDTLDIVYKLLG